MDRIDALLEFSIFHSTFHGIEGFGNISGITNLGLNHIALKCRGIFEVIEVLGRLWNPLQVNSNSLDVSISLQAIG
jgi:hypothetical protein